MTTDTPDREQELSDTILRQSTEIETLKRQVRALRAGLEYAVNDAVKAMRADLKRSRAILDALDKKMGLTAPAATPPAARSHDHNAQGHGQEEE